MARPRAPRGQARARVIDAALQLFAELGVSGTSLQMIAQRLGVTKAAVYHQFRAKEDIVLAVLDDAITEIRALVDEAERVVARDGTGDGTADGAEDGVRRLVPGLVKLTFGHRHALAALSRDPEMIRIIEQHPDFRDVIQRMEQVLHGAQPDLSRRVAVSMLGAALAHVAVDPHLVDVDDDALQSELTRTALTLLLG